MWQLITVTDTEWIQDASGYYTFIHYVSDNVVRLDYMDKNDNPVISFQGKASDVRKNAIRYAEKQIRYFSVEHASYIGRELVRAELLGSEYVQD